MPDYSRFHVSQVNARFSLLDQQTGWVWQDIKGYGTVLKMMQYILDRNLQFQDEEYKRIRRLDGNEWEAELK